MRLFQRGPALYSMKFRSGSDRRGVSMPKTLHDKLAELDPARIARIRAEADRLQAEQLAGQKAQDSPADIQDVPGRKENLS